MPNAGSNAFDRAACADRRHQPRSCRAVHTTVPVGRPSGGRIRWAGLLDGSGTSASAAPSVYLGGMSNGLRDTVALVTGASSGIGEATARALAAHGATVAVVARRRERLVALAAEIGGLAIETDVTNREQAQAAVERTAQEFGRLDIVVNSAGVMLLGPIVDAPVE